MTLDFDQLLTNLTLTSKDIAFNDPNSPYMERKPPGTPGLFSGDESVCACCNEKKLKAACDFSDLNRNFNHKCRLQLHHCAILKKMHDGNQVTSTCQCRGKKDCESKKMWEGNIYCGQDPRKPDAEPWECVNLPTSEWKCDKDADVKNWKK